jgi:tRNA pseudouridine38-40 synthase
MRRLRINVAYDGTDFHGWQVQPELPTVQGSIEAVLTEIEESPVHINGSGRTDAGVHALAQVASFDLANPIPCENLRRAMNRLLPPSIRVTDAREAPEGFHARHHALAKTYEYRIERAEVCSPFERRYVHHHPYPLDREAMIRLARVFEGTHDFAHFAASDDRYTDEFDMTRTIFSSVLEDLGGRLRYRVRGSGFLKHMVRNLVGTLIEAGRNNIAADRWPEKSGPTAPASGLFLVCVEYPGDVESGS